MSYVNLRGRDVNFDRVLYALYDDPTYTIRLYLDRGLALLLEYEDQASYDEGVLAVKTAIGSPISGDVAISGDLSVEGSVRSMGVDGNYFQACWNINLNEALDGPADEAIGIGFTRITLDGGTGTGSMLFSEFLHTPAPFNRPPHVIGQVVGDATKQDDPFTVIDVTLTGFSWDGHPGSTVDIIVLGAESYIG